MKGKETGERLGRSLYLIYIIMLAVSVVFVFRIFYIQFLWTPNKEIERKLTQPVRKETLIQKRGSILSCDGRVLAMSYPKYQLFIDCCTNQEEVEKLSKEKREEYERKWRKDAALFAKGLEEAFAPNGASSDYYYNLLIKSHNKGSHYLKLGKPIE